MLKHFTEFGLNTYAEYLFLTQQDSLEKLSQEDLKDIPCHIYVIGRKPRVSLDHKTFSIDENWVKGTLKFRQEDYVESRDFILPNRLGNHNLRLECPYPYSEFSLWDVNGKCFSSAKAGLLAHLSPKMEGLTDFEVLYIGQAYGNQGSRKATDRLQSHSTLQAIYHEVSTRSPDQEVWLLLLNFEAALYTIFNGQEKYFKTTQEEDDIHLNNVLETGITEQQAINFTEAALIRYFEPEFNEIFKNTFPDPVHRTYSECYELDINSVMVTIETEDIRSRLWSQRRAKSWCHIASFALHGTEDRKSLFDIMSSI